MLNGGERICLAAATLADTVLKPVQIAVAPVCKDENHVGNVMAHALQIGTIFLLQHNLFVSLCQCC